MSVTSQEILATNEQESEIDPAPNYKLFNLDCLLSQDSDNE